MIEAMSPLGIMLIKWIGSGFIAILTALTSVLWRRQTLLEKRVVDHEIESAERHGCVKQSIHDINNSISRVESSQHEIMKDIKELLKGNKNGIN